MGHLLTLVLCGIVLIKSGILLVERHALTFFNGLLWVGLLLFMLAVTADWATALKRTAE